MPPPPPRPPSGRNHNAEASCKIRPLVARARRPADFDLTVEAPHPNGEAPAVFDLTVESPAHPSPSHPRNSDLRASGPLNAGCPPATDLEADSRRANGIAGGAPRQACRAYPSTTPPRRPSVPTDIRSYLPRPSMSSPSAAGNADSKLPDLSGLNPALYHRYKRIATPRVITFNIRGLSMSENADRTRSRRVRTTLRALAKLADVILLQETMCNLKNLDGLRLIPGFKAFVNPGSTAIFIRISLLEGCTLKHTIIDPGFIHSVDVVPREDASPIFLASWSVLNVYLKCGVKATDLSKRRSQLQLLNRYTSPTDFLLAAGDWNMVLSSNDTSTGSHAASYAQDQKSLRNALHHLGLNEAYQPDFTRKGPTPSGSIAGSRLDRPYYSHSTPYQTVMKASSEVLPFPFSDAAKAQVDKGIAALTDHWPVRMLFHPNSIEQGFRFKIPKHVAKDPALIEAIEAEWSTTDKPDHPIHLLSSFKKVILAQARSSMAARRTKATSNSARLTVAITLLNRGLAGVRPIVLRRRFGAIAPDLVHLFKQDYTEHKGRSFPALTSLVADLMAEPSVSPPPSQEKRVPFNFLKFAKNTLPSSREHITSLAKGSDVIDRAADIAAEL